MIYEKERKYGGKKGNLNVEKAGSSMGTNTTALEKMGTGSTQYNHQISRSAY